MARDFTDILNAVWAANALTTIPNPPIPGQAYRNTEIDDSNLENGQQYSEVYDSARYNQLLYLLSGCLKMLMETGLPEWSAKQNYQKGAYTVGRDGEIYGPAKKASGPDNGRAVDPVTDAAGDGTTWQRSLPKFAPQFAIENKELGIIGNAPYSDTGSIDDYKLPGTYRLGIAVKNLPVAITTTSTLVVYGSGNADTSNIPLDVVQVFIAELASNATQLWVRVGTPSGTWGTWTRQDAGSLKPFVAPTQSSPGKQGLVPAPLKTPDNELLNRFLSAKGGWGGIDLCALHPTAQSAELNKVLLDMGGVSGEGVNIDTLLRSGFFAANIFAGTLPEGVTGGVLINIMSRGNNGLYYGQQILVSYINYRLYFRGNIDGIQPGGTVNWLPWTCLTRTPQAAAGVGQWIKIGQNASSVTLPAGGAWAYHICAYNNLQGILLVNDADVAAGGTVLEYGIVQPSTTLVCGFAWRIA